MGGLSKNPIFMRYWHSEMRPAVFYPMLALLFIIVGIYSFTYIDLFIHGYKESLRELLTIYLWIQFFVLYVIGAASIYMGIYKEKESNMFDFYKISPLESPAIIIGFLFGLSMRSILLSLLLVPFIISCAVFIKMPLLFYFFYIIFLVISPLFLYMITTYASFISRWAFILLILIIFLFSTIFSQFVDSVLSMFFSSLSSLPLMFFMHYYDSDYMVHLIPIIMSFIIQPFYTIFFFIELSKNLKSNGKHTIRRGSAVTLMLITTLFMTATIFFTLLYPEGSFSSISEVFVFVALIVMLGVIFSFTSVPSKAANIKWAIQIPGKPKKKSVSYYIKNYIFDRDSQVVDISLIYGVITCLCILAIFFASFISLSSYSAEHLWLLYSFHFMFVITTCGCIYQFFKIMISKHAELYTVLTFIFLWGVLPVIGLIINNNPNKYVKSELIRFFPFASINEVSIAISCSIMLISVFAAILAVNRLKKTYGIAEI